MNNFFFGEGYLFFQLIMHINHEINSIPPAQPLFQLARKMTSVADPKPCHSTLIRAASVMIVGFTNTRTTSKTYSIDEVHAQIVSNNPCPVSTRNGGGMSVEVDAIKWALKDIMVRKALETYGIDCSKSSSRKDGVVGAFVNGFQVTFRAGYKYDLTAGKF
jgi:hypothetical protein